MSDITQFAKWFDLNGMDFQLTNISGMWRCSCWPRTDEEDDVDDPSRCSYWSSAYCETVWQALMGCYEVVRTGQRNR